jgi:dihydrofolate reductase
VRALYSFHVLTVDGYYEGPNGEFDWPNVDDEFNRFSVEQINASDMILFGRVTYEMMAAYWPSPTAADENDPMVVELMNSMPKIVFSSSLTEATWNNTRLVGGNIAEEITALKHQPGKDLAIFGSFRLTTSLLEMGLIDRLGIMIHPVVLGQGKSLFTGLGDRISLRLLRTTIFRSGNVLLTYQPIAPS